MLKKASRNGKSRIKFMVAYMEEYLGWIPVVATQTFVVIIAKGVAVVPQIAWV